MVKNNRKSNSFIKNNITGSKIEQKFSNYIQNKLKITKKNIIMILGFDEIIKFNNLIIKYYRNRFETYKIIFINDANGIFDVIKTLKSVNNSNRMIDLLYKLQEIYMYNYYQTVGMMYDSFREIFLNKRLQMKYTNIQIFDFEIYNKIFIDIWSNFVFIKNIISFDSEKILNNIFSFTIYYNSNHTFNFDIKYFNTKSFIRELLYYLITPSVSNTYLKNYSLNSFNEYKKLFIKFI